MKPQRMMNWPHWNTCCSRCLLSLLSLVMISIKFDQLSPLDPMWSSEGHGRTQEPRVCRKVCGGVPVATILRQSQNDGPLTPSGHTEEVQCRDFMFSDLLVIYFL